MVPARPGQDRGGRGGKGLTMSPHINWNDPGHALLHFPPFSPSHGPHGQRMCNLVWWSRWRCFSATGPKWTKLERRASVQQVCACNSVTLDGARKASARKKCLILRGESFLPFKSKRNSNWLLSVSSSNSKECFRPCRCRQPGDIPSVAIHTVRMATRREQN